MQIAQVLAGYTLGGADLLRRAMGKKKPEEMAKQRSHLRRRRDRSAACPSTQAAHIFDLMEKFAGYGFNKSHSAAYALLSYQTGWLKAHYPAAFMAAVLSADMDHTDKVVDADVRLPRRMRPQGRSRRDVNLSHYDVHGRRRARPSATDSARSRAWAGRVECWSPSARRTARSASLDDLCRRSRPEPHQSPRARSADPLRQPRSDSARTARR